MSRSPQLRRCCIALTMLLSMSRGSPAQTKTAVEPLTASAIVQRYIDARGGLASIKAVRTMILRGPPRPNGKPGRTMTRARPFYLSIGVEGNDGSPWEGYDDYGLRARVTDAPAAALRHTAYFDDPLVMSLEPGWQVELTGTELIEGRPAYRLRVIFPDGWVNECFVDKESWLMVARRATAPVHAFGEAVTGEAHIGDYRRVSTGALYPMRLVEYDLKTGQYGDPETWASIEVNVVLPTDVFAPPPIPDTPVARMINAVFEARHITADALLFYHDFRSDPATSHIDIEPAIESVGYHCLKNGAIPTGFALLSENLREHPQSARAHFGVGRALRASGREAEAVAEFREALRLDPTLQAASDALASKVLKY